MLQILVMYQTAASFQLSARIVFAVVHLFHSSLLLSLHENEQPGDPDEESPSQITAEADAPEKLNIDRAFQLTANAKETTIRLETTRRIRRRTGSQILSRRQIKSHENLLSAVKELALTQ
jgi:hypothetical protein